MPQSGSVRTALVSILLVVPLAAIDGCRKSDLPELGEVTGVITIDGKTPTAPLLVNFDALAGRSSSAMTTTDGRYTLMYKEGVPGAAVGSYTVRISKTFDPANPDPEKMHEAPLPKKYNDDTTLKADVKKGKNEFDFKLTSK